MTDIEAIAYFVNPDEMFANAPQSNKNMLKPKDVYYIAKLGKPIGSNIDYLYKVFSYTRKRLVVNGIEDITDWIKYFSKLDCEYMEYDDSTVIFDREL